MDTTAIIPYSTRRLPAYTAAVPLAAGAIGATLGFPAALLAFEHQLAAPGAELFVSSTTMLLSVLVARRAVTRGSPSAAARSAIAWSLLAGGVNAGVAFEFVSRGAPPLVPLFAGTLLGIFLASPLAIGFSAVYATMAAAARHGASARSRQGEDKLVGELGLAVLLAGVARATWVEDLWSIVPIALGAAVAGFAFDRAVRRARWIRAVARGRVDGFALVPADEHDDGALPCLTGDARLTERVIVHQPPPVASYRTPTQSSRRIARVSS